MIASRSLLVYVVWLCRDVWRAVAFSHRGVGDGLVGLLLDPGTPGVQEPAREPVRRSERVVDVADRDRNRVALSGFNTVDLAVTTDGEDVPVAIELAERCALVRH